LLAIECWVTGFDAVADVVVVAVTIIGCVHTVVDARVAGVVGTGDTIIAAWRCALHAGAGVTGFHAVAEHSIITVRINCALGRLAVRIIPVVEEVSVVVQAQSITAVVLATIYRGHHARIAQIHVGTQVVGPCICIHDVFGCRRRITRMACCARETIHVGFHPCFGVVKPQTVLLMTTDATHPVTA